MLITRRPGKENAFEKCRHFNKASQVVRDTQTREESALLPSIFLLLNTELRHHLCHSKYIATTINGILLEDVVVVYSPSPSDQGSEIAGQPLGLS